MLPALAAYAFSFVGYRAAFSLWAGALARSLWGGYDAVRARVDAAADEDARLASVCARSSVISGISACVEATARSREWRDVRFARELLAQAHWCGPFNCAAVNAVVDPSAWWLALALIVLFAYPGFQLARSAHERRKRKKLK